jgi:hypothetical protein
MGFRGEEVAGGAENIFGLDGQQAGFRLRVAGVVAAALGAAQYLESGTEWTVSAGIGGPIDADDGADQGAGQVERAGVSRDYEGSAAGEGDELFKGANEGCGCAACGFGNRFSARLLAGAGIDQHAQTAIDEALGDRRISIRRPALGAPASAGVNENCVFLRRGWQNFVGPSFGGWVNG